MKLRVLMFGWEFPPHNSGGLGTACFGLTKAMSALPVEVIFVLPKRVAVNADFMKLLFADIQKFSFHQVETLVYPYITSEQYAEIRLGQPSIYGRNLIDEVRLYGERARMVVKNLKFEVIHAHDWLAYPAGMVAKAISGKPLVVHVHATEFDRTGGNGINSAVYEIEKAGMTAADRVIAISHWTKNLIMKHYGIPEAKIEVVHNGIDATEYCGKNIRLKELKQAGYKIVLFVGRLTLQKGPDYFIKVAKRVLEHQKKVYFIVAGSGDMERQTIDEAARLGISDRVIFCGFLRGQELNDLYASADLYVLPSISEPFGLTPLESLVNGTPVLVSKQSGVAEVLRHALKVDFWDIDDMTDKILGVINHPSLRTTLAANGEAEARRITWLEAAQKCLNVYERVINIDPKLT